MLGDDLLAQGAELGAVKQPVMFPEGFPEVEKRSVNAYWAVFRLLKRWMPVPNCHYRTQCKAQSDSRVRIHAFGWTPEDYDSWPAGRWPVILLVTGRKPEAAISQIGIWSKIRLPILAIRLPKYGQMAILPAQAAGSGAL